MLPDAHQLQRFAYRPINRAKLQTIPDDLPVATNNERNWKITDVEVGY